MTHPFTPTYISMAKAAEEIQAMRLDLEDYQLGDWYLDDHGPELYDRSTGYMGETPAYLPRLDQLLGMLGGPSAWHALHLDIEGDAWSDFPGVSDWHELALAVVMREKYGKVWTGSEWAKA